MTPFRTHCSKWGGGCGSDYCSSAIKKTFYRGDIPADILFIGEAPGKSENIEGIPFSPGAQAGGLLTRIIRQSVPVSRPHDTYIVPEGKPGGTLKACKNCSEYEAGLDNPCKPYRIGFTNIVACIPRLEGEEKIEPDADQITSCRPRLEEIIKIANPRLIFAVGSQSRDVLTQGYTHSTRIPKGCMVVHIVHPAWILRQTVAFQGLEIQRVCCVIKDAIRELENPEFKTMFIDRNRVVGHTPPTSRSGLRKPKSNTPTNKHGIMDDPPPLREEDIPF
jgi:uracil-DNA glycosylase